MNDLLKKYSDLNSSSLTKDEGVKRTETNSSFSACRSEEIINESTASNSTVIPPTNLQNSYIQIQSELLEENTHLKAELNKKGKLIRQIQNDNQKLQEEKLNLLRTIAIQKEQLECRNDQLEETSKKLHKQEEVLQKLLYENNKINEEMRFLVHDINQDNMNLRKEFEQLYSSATEAMKKYGDHKNDVLKENKIINS